MKIVKFYILISILNIIYISGCKEKTTDNLENQNHKNTSLIQQPTVPAKTRITSPQDNASLTTGDTVYIAIRVKDSISTVDSIVLFINEKRTASFSKPDYQYKWNTADCRTGKQTIRSIAYFVNKTSETQKVSIRLRSDIKPRRYTYKIINKYPHDANAFLQGLVYENGIFYEGTGQYGASSIRRVKPETGEVIESFDVSRDIFGEGVTIVGDKIIQLSWKEKTGFIYDKKTFRQLNTFNYDTEGWGLTYDGRQLIMSDGSYTLYFINTVSYTVTDQIEVYDNVGPVNQLNELEYINGEIYANVYTTEKIVRIDPATGKVLGQIDFSGLLKTIRYTGKVDVMNGIAYDSQNNRLFVTGKWWPMIFQVELVEK